MTIPGTMSSTRRIRWTVGRKIACLGAIGLAGVVGVAAIAADSTRALTTANQDITVVASALRNHLEADMMHEAVRGDVYAALLATSDAESKQAIVDLTDHEDILRTNLDENAGILEGASAAAVEESAPALDAYVADARKIVELAATDTDKAGKLLPDFGVAFSDLETSLGEISDLIEKEATAAKTTADAAADRSNRLILIVSLIALAAVAVAAWFISGRIRKAVAACLGGLAALAAGDLTQRVHVSGSDEIAELAGEYNRAMTELGATVRSVAAHSDDLALSSDGLAATSKHLGRSADETSAQAGAVSAAAEQVSANVATVAGAAEEMGASINEIAASATEASRVASEAVAAAGHANSTVSKLGESSTDIAEVAKVITSIAEQTNLLALNATIEAARAGEAGKGFAVVANEVKELAQQTAQATESIGRKISTIQNDAAASIEAITGIGDVISRIHDLQSTIASAVEEQTATTGEISRSVNEASQGSVEIASNISGVAQTAGSTARGAEDSQSAAAELAKLADGLRGLTSKFIWDRTGDQVQTARSSGAPLLKEPVVAG